jgi:5-methyltetrahydropteroyltriglutamate--homocysteine methyltransferase
MHLANRPPLRPFLFLINKRRHLNLLSENNLTLTMVGNYPKTPDLPHPPRLRRALTRLDSGSTTQRDLAYVEDEVTLEVLAIQAELGLALLTDGQVRWSDEVTYVAGRLGGVGLGKMIRWFDTNTYFREPVVRSEVRWQGPITGRDYAFARDSTPLPVKAVLPGPYTLAMLSRDETYGDTLALALAYAEALNHEARVLQSLGAPVIQFNEPSVTQPGAEMAIAMAAWQRLLNGLNVETAVHLYFGPSEAALPVAIAAGFVTVGIDATIAGSIRSLESGPIPRKLCLGAVDSRVRRMETREDVASLVRRAQQAIGERPLYLSPNMGLEFLPREQAWMKLRLLADVVGLIGAPS